MLVPSVHNPFAFGAKLPQETCSQVPETDACSCGCVEGTVAGGCVVFTLGGSEAEDARVLGTTDISGAELAGIEGADVSGGISNEPAEPCPVPVEVGIELGDCPVPRWDDASAIKYSPGFLQATKLVRIANINNTAQNCFTELSP